jgi:hypothetical protein
VDERDRTRWARALVFAGWMSVLAWFGILVGTIRRAAALREGSFEDGVWGQRIEFVSFASLPQNAIVLVPAVAAAVAAAMLTRGIVDPSVLSTRQLVRVVAGASVLVVVLALAGIADVFARTNDPISDLGTILGHAGGIALAAASLRLCSEAART